MIVVSNTSPMINLAAIGQLDWLQQLYGEVIIPPAVYDEIVISGAGQPGAVEIGEADWLKVQPVSNQALATALRMELDAGEAEAIALAVEMKADLLLIDERKGRRIAEKLNCRLIGLLGVLIEALPLVAAQPADCAKTGPGRTPGEGRLSGEPGVVRACAANSGRVIVVRRPGPRLPPYSLLPTSYSLLPTPYSLLPAPHLPLKPAML